MRSALLAAALTVVPRAVLACPVCFGQNDSPLALGVNYGIYFLLAIIVGLWMAFGSFFIHLKRRADLAEAASEEVRGVRLQPDHQEGTV